MVMILTMMFSVNVSAAETQSEVTDVGIQREYVEPEYSFGRTFKFTDDLWGDASYYGGKCNVYFGIYI